LTEKEKKNLIKLPNSKTRSARIKEKDIYEDWGLDDVTMESPEARERKTEAKQLNIISLEIIDEFPKKVWEYGTFSVEEDFKRREVETSVGINLKIFSEEIVPVPFVKKIEGVIYHNAQIVCYLKILQAQKCYRMEIEDYIKWPRLVICENGDRLKYNKGGNIEWVFS
jgi:hypothetical protein